MDKVAIEKNEWEHAPPGIYRPYTFVSLHERKSERVISICYETADEDPITHQKPITPRGLLAKREFKEIHFRKERAGSQYSVIEVPLRDYDSLFERILSYEPDSHGKIRRTKNLVEINGLTYKDIEYFKLMPFPGWLVPSGKSQ